MIELEFIRSGDERYLGILREHYPVKLRREEQGVETKPGNYGQALHFIVLADGRDVGIISAGAAVYTTPARDAFFKLPPRAAAKTAENYRRSNFVQSIVDNVQFHMVPGHGISSSDVLALWRDTCEHLWPRFYGVRVIGFETFVWGINPETGLPRDGYIYRRDRWKKVGETKGKAKQHIRGDGGAGMEVSRTHRDTEVKIVFCRWASPEIRAAVERGELPDVYHATWGTSKKTKNGEPYLDADEIERRKALKKERTGQRDAFYGRRFRG